jgi:hypothetical protein
MGPHALPFAVRARKAKPGPLSVVFRVRTHRGANPQCCADGCDGTDDDSCKSADRCLVIYGGDPRRVSCARHFRVFVENNNRPRHARHEKPSASGFRQRKPNQINGWGGRIPMTGRFSQLIENTGLHPAPRSRYYSFADNRQERIAIAPVSPSLDTPAAKTVHHFEPAQLFTRQIRISEVCAYAG